MSLDCGIEASICVQYSVFVNGPPRAIAYSAACTAMCDTLIWRYNYLEGATYPSARLIGTIANNGDKTPGRCLTVESYIYGTLMPGSVVTGPDIRQMKVTDVPCNGENSFTLASLRPIDKNNRSQDQYTPSKPMYANQGIHGDPQFVVVTPRAAKIPTVLGPFVHSYSTTLFPENAYGATGAVTWNTTNGPVVRSATVDNCTPSCGSGLAGNTLNVKAIDNIGLYPGKIAIGESIGGNGSINPQTIITGDSNGGEKCNNVPCTGTGNTGTYAVSGPPQRAAITSNWEFTGVNMTKLQIDHNVLVMNKINLGKEPNEAASGGAILGDNHAMTISEIDITDNYYDPIGAWFCIDPRFNNSPSGWPPIGNVNLLGNGAGGRDPKENTRLCDGRY